MASLPFRSIVLVAIAPLALACSADQHDAAAVPAAVAPAPVHAPPIANDEWAIPHCEPDEELCGPVCVAVEHDYRHCGACGQACGPNEVCSMGHCRVASEAAPADAWRPPHPMRCPSDQAACGASCIDLASDRVHCGRCGAPCDGSCVHGRCLPPI